MVGLFVYRKVYTMFFGNNVSTKFNDTWTFLRKSQANHYADMLYQAMKDFGTDEDEIKLIQLELSRPSDLRTVYNAFDVKPYGSFGAPVLGFGGSDMDLRGWLKAELSGSDYAVWEQMFKTAGI
jgi:hypothetical protein